MGSRLRVAGQQLIVAPGEGLFNPPQLGASNALPRRRPVASFRSHVLPDPLPLRLGSSLCCDPRHVGQGRLPGIPLWQRLPGVSAGGGVLCVQVVRLAAMYLNSTLRGQGPFSVYCGAITVVLMRLNTGRKGGCYGGGVAPIEG